MASKVYFTDMHPGYGENLMDKLERLVKKAGINDVIEKNDLVAVKLHFGEPGNLAYIRPNYVQRIVRVTKSFGGKPFLTDSNTLYIGKRSNAVDHLNSAIKNGFTYSMVEAPIIIADGIRGDSYTEVEVNLELVKKAMIGSAVYNADALIVLTHFKGHELTGFGGTLKNIGMGIASRGGKLEQHSGMGTKVNESKCIGCGTCAKFCPGGAIEIMSSKAVIDYDECIGCGECLVVCPTGAMEVKEYDSADRVAMKIAEYTYAVLKNKKDKAFFVSFIMNISPYCDCYSSNDVPIVPDIGMAASKDPIALEQACADLVNDAPGYKDSQLKTNFEPGEDKFKGLFPGIDWETQIKHGEEIGLGNRKYELVRI